MVSATFMPRQVVAVPHAGLFTTADSNFKRVDAGRGGRPETCGFLVDNTILLGASSMALMGGKSPALVALPLDRHREP